MKDLSDHKKIAVLIDADNAQHSKVQSILEEISAHGHIVVKRAYADWSEDRLKNWKKTMNELAIQPIQQFAYTTGKNSTDAALIIDAMDLLYSERFDAFALVSSDSDFTRLAARLRESEIFVLGFGEKKTPISFRNACDDFVMTENLNIAAPELEKPKHKPAVVKLINMLTKAWAQYQEDDGWARLSVAGSFVKRSDPSFDPRSFGEKNMSSLIIKLGDVFEVNKTPVKGVRTTHIKYRPIEG